MSVIRGPQTDHTFPVSVRPILDGHPVILAIPGKVEIGLLHHPHEFLLIIARGVDQVAEDSLRDHFLGSARVGSV